MNLKNERRKGVRMVRRMTRFNNEYKMMFTFFACINIQPFIKTIPDGWGGGVVVTIFFSLYRKYPGG